jgi:hypothetical protein
MAVSNVEDVGMVRVVVQVKGLKVKRMVQYFIFNVHVHVHAQAPCRFSDLQNAAHTVTYSSSQCRRYEVACNANGLAFTFLNIFFLVKVEVEIVALVSSKNFN